LIKNVNIIRLSKTWIEKKRRGKRSISRSFVWKYQRTIEKKK
jgi:hypothetical protein